jgi:MFS family permease
MQSVALGIVLTERTHNPEWLGILMLAGWLPAVIGSPLGGAIADRFNRQRWIQLNNAVMALTATSLAVLEFSHHLTPLDACALALVEGLSGSSSWAASQSLVRDLVEPEEVLAAVSLSSAQFNLGRIIGPVVAGVIMATSTAATCFAINAASFIFVVIVFAFVRTPVRARPNDRLRLVVETAWAARVAGRTPGCRNPIIAVAVVAVLGSPFIALVPSMAIDVLHAGKAGTSVLVTAQGVGAVLGAVFLPGVAKRIGRVRVIRSALVTMCIGEVLYGLAPTLALSAAALVVVGGAYVGTLTGLNTTVQLLAPESERSRIIALYTLSMSVAYPIGSFIQSVLARHVGLRPVMVGGGTSLLCVTLIASVAARQFWQEFRTPLQ